MHCKLISWQTFVLPPIQPQNIKIIVVIRSPSVRRGFLFRKGRDISLPYCVQPDFLAPTNQRREAGYSPASSAEFDDTLNYTPTPLCTFVAWFQLKKEGWLSQFLLRNLKQVIVRRIEGRLEVAERRGRRHKQLLDDLKEKRVYWLFEVEALDRTLWSTPFWRGYETVIRLRSERMNEWITPLSPTSVYN
jgi:hypothetical protein